MASQSDEKKSDDGADSATDNGKSSQSNQEAGKELIDELTHLGQKFVEVVEVAWNSEQRKKIEEDLRSGLVTVASTLEDGFKRVSTTKEAKEAVNAAEGVAEKVRSSKIAVELSGALADGLRSLSEQMDKLTQELKQKAAATSESVSESVDKATQDIPVTRDESSRSTVSDVANLEPHEAFQVGC